MTNSTDAPPPEPIRHAAPPTATRAPPPSPELAPEPGSPDPAASGSQTADGDPQVETEAVLEDDPDDDALARPSFEVLYGVARSYLPDALRLSRVPREDVDDLVHDVVLVAYRGLDRYVPKVGPPGAPPDALRSLKSWLSAIAWRLLAKRRGRAYRRFELPQGDAAELAGDLEGPPTSEQVAASAQRLDLLAGVLRRLRPERAEVLMMSAFMDMSVSDIAEELRLNPNTVKSRLARARADVIAEIRRLRRDEQSVLEGSTLCLALTLEGESAPCPIGGAPAAPALGAAPEVASWRRPRLLDSTPGLVASAAGVLALGMALGAAATRPGRPLADEAPIAAAHEAARAVLSPAPRVEARPPPSPVGGELTGATRPPGAPVDRPASPASPREVPHPRGPLARPSTSGALALELAWLTAAKRALYEGAVDRALLALQAHRREFPEGELAAERDLLLERTRAPARGAPEPLSPAALATPRAPAAPGLARSGASTPRPPD